MGIREKLNQNPRIATGITIAIIVAVLAVIIIQLVLTNPRTGGGKEPPPEQAYFTIDDGDNTFNQVRNKFAPFDYNGQQAVQAHMFTCDDGHTRFVAYLSKLNDRARKLAEKAPKDERGRITDNERVSELLLWSNRLVRHPKSKNANSRWVPGNSAEGREIVNVLCPDGSRAVEVFTK